MTTISTISGWRSVSADSGSRLTINGSVEADVEVGRQEIFYCKSANFLCGDCM